MDGAVLAVFSTVTKRQWEKLLGIFAELTDNPFLPGSPMQRDYIGRSPQLPRFGEWSVTYWSEHLANSVHIIAIEHLRI